MTGSYIYVKTYVKTRTEHTYTWIKIRQKGLARVSAHAHTNSHTHTHTHIYMASLQIHGLVGNTSGQTCICEELTMTEHLGYMGMD